MTPGAVPGGALDDDEEDEKDEEEEEETVLPGAPVDNFVSPAPPLDSPPPTHT